MTNYAEQLLDVELPNGWKVVRKFDKSTMATGGFFSIGYVVERSNERAFLKVLDYSEAMGTRDPARVLQTMTAAFNHERSLCQACSERKMSRVIRYMEDGTYYFDPLQPLSVIQYIIFELASGDIRSYLDRMREFDIAVLLRTLHSTAVGIRQLHTAGMVHQDIKPSNILQCDDGLSKLGDLGRASSRALTGPHDAATIPGDVTYAPFEQLYQDVSSDWNVRRRAADLYHLGNLVVFLFARANITALTIGEMAPELHYHVWKDGFPLVLPYIRRAFADAVAKFKASLPSSNVSELVDVVTQLCNPDPALRGHPTAQIGHRDRYDLQPYISIFDRLARKAELGLSR